MFDPANSSCDNNETNNDSIQNLKENKEKVLITEIKKNIGKIIAFMIFFIIFAFLTAWPMSINFVEARWYVKILMILSTLYALLIMLIFSAIMYEQKNSKSVLFLFLPFFAFFLLSLVSYFKYDLWGHKNLLVGISIGWMLLVGIYDLGNIIFLRAIDSSNRLISLISIAIFISIIALTSKFFDDKNYTVLYQISIGICYVIAIVIFLNHYIYKNNQGKIINSILGIIFWGSLLTVSFPFYVQWCGLTGEDFKTYISIYSSLLGGGIAMAGVAWTIQNNYNVRKQDESQKNIPYITLVSFKCKKRTPILNCAIEINKTKKSNFKTISSFFIKNVSNTIILLESIEIEGMKYKFDKKMCFAPNMIIKINCCSDNLFISQNGNIKYIYLWLINALNEKYKIKCYIKINKTKAYQITDILFPERVEE